MSTRKNAVSTCSIKHHTHEFIWLGIAKSIIIILFGAIMTQSCLVSILYIILVIIKSGEEMKLLLSCLVLVCGMQANADSLSDILNAVGGGRNQVQSHEDYPSYPDRPGRGGEVCTASDRGWEEHRGAHFSCRECLAVHGECVETCRSPGQIQCEAHGVDRRGRLVAFYGVAQVQRRAERRAYDACSYNARNCRVVRCDQTGGTETRRNCRY